MVRRHVARCRQPTVGQINNDSVDYEGDISMNDKIRLCGQMLNQIVMMMLHRLPIQAGLYNANVANVVDAACIYCVSFTTVGDD